MAVLVGSIAASPVGATLSPALVGSLNGYTFDQWPAHQEVSALTLGGVVTSQLPVSVTPVALSGAVAENYGDDFFQYFSFDPPVLDAGFVSATITKPLKIWNRNGVPATLLSISGIGDEGVTHNVEVGDAWDRYQERTFQFVITTEGPGILAALYHLVFDVGGEEITVHLSISGIRARVWRFPPDWKSGYTTNYAYKTESFKSRVGKEQRRALRHNPRFYNEFDISLMGGRLAEFDTMMAGWQNRPFVMPDYTESVSLFTAAEPGGETIVVDGTPDWLVADAQIMLSNLGKTSLHVVGDVTGSTVTLTPYITQAWPSGTTVYRGYTGYVQQSMSVSTPTNMVGTTKIRFDALPATTVPAVTTAAETYNGRELFLKKPNWSSSPQVDMEYEIDKVDYDRGHNTFFNIVEFITKTTKATYLAKTRAEVDQFRKFFDRMKGMRGEFYAPTWKPDMTIASSITAGAVNLVVEGVDTYEFLRGSTVYKKLVIVKNDGTLLKNSVTNMTVTDKTTIVCGTPWPAVNKNDVLMVCWMPVWTLASDILTISWVTDSVAQIGLAMRTVEDI